MLFFIFFKIISLFIINVNDLSLLAIFFSFCDGEFIFICDILYQFFFKHIFYRFECCYCFSLKKMKKRSYPCSSYKILSYTLIFYWSLVATGPTLIFLITCHSQIFNSNMLGLHWHGTNSLFSFDLYLYIDHKINTSGHIYYSKTLPQ
jgi:hypothetical protein